MEFITELKERGDVLFYFGLLNLIWGIALIVIAQNWSIQLSGVNSLNKPIKFALSIGVYSWTMSWFIHYLKADFSINSFAWVTVILFGFEIIYISLQAFKGELSHFNLSTPSTSFMFGLMGIAATIVTLYTADIAVLFFTSESSGLPDYYLWSIRLGLIIFVIFSLEGFVMGSNLSHTIGGEDGNHGWAFLNWSRQYGDPRVAHFIGMHALQIIPLVSFYFLKDVKLTFILTGVYFLLSVYVLAQALNGKPFLR